MTSEYLPRLTSFFPWSLVVALFVALLFAIIGVLIYKRATTKDEDEVQNHEERHHPLWEKITTFLSRFGLFSTDPLNKSFSYALKMMRSFIGGTQSQYQLPWILMLGASDAGKSALLQNLDLDRPLDQPHFEEENGEKSLCDWYFYDHGIVLDLDGKIVLDATRAVSDESKWKLS
jgi:type VI protein secretion system component VasK